MKVTILAAVVLSWSGPVGAQCVGDANGDGVVTIDEIVAVVDSALHGCDEGEVRLERLIGVWKFEHDSIGSGVARYVFERIQGGDLVGRDLDTRMPVAVSFSDAGFMFEMAPTPVTTAFCRMILFDQIAPNTLAGEIRSVGREDGVCTETPLAPGIPFVGTRVD